jgi:hypothetical protein
MLIIYLLLYVDDMLIAAKDKSEIAKLKAQPLQDKPPFTNISLATHNLPVARILPAMLGKCWEHHLVFLSFFLVLGCASHAFIFFMPSFFPSKRKCTICSSKKEAA